MHSARSSTISDSAGRAALFLGAVSTTLIAIAFIGQISELGTVFFLFALTILPTMFFLGLVTYVRALQSAVEDVLFAWAAQRIRTVFASIEPEWRRCFVLAAGDPRYGLIRDLVHTRSRWQVIFTTASSIGLINSVVGGVIVGLVVEVTADPPLAVSTGIGLIFTLVSAALHLRHQHRRLVSLEAALDKAMA